MTPRELSPNEIRCLGVGCGIRRDCQRFAQIGLDRYRLRGAAFDKSDRVCDEQENQKYFLPRLEYPA